MPSPEIAVTGMNELRRSLRELADDNGWRAPLRDAYRNVATLVEGEARQRANTPRATLAGTSATMGGRAAASIRGKGTTTGASLDAFKGAPWGPGWNFGSLGARRQFPRKTTPDYNLYAAVEDKRQAISDGFAEEVERALARAFPD